MVNQYTKKEYTDSEINQIILFYNSGMSFTKIGLKLNRQKNTIKKILIENSVWVEGRDKLKKEFSVSEIDTIKFLYLNEKLSCDKIANVFGVSKEPIKTLLKKDNLLRIGYSDGIKIILTEEQKYLVKHMYLKEYKSYSEISVKTNLSEGLIQNYVSKIGVKRTKSQGASVGGVKKYRNILYSDYLATLPEYEIYKKKVISLTNKQPIKTLLNYNKRGVSGIDGAYQLDHKYSIVEGFKNKISPEIIANMNNLEFIPWLDNAKKKTKCTITMENLIIK